MNKDKVIRHYELTSGLVFPEPFMSMLHTHYTDPVISVFDKRSGSNRGIMFRIKDKVILASVTDRTEEEVDTCKRILENWLEKDE